MKRYHLVYILIFASQFCIAQVSSIGSRDTISNANNYYANQYVSPLHAKNADFYNGDLIKGRNSYAAVHTYLVKDFNGDGYADLFLSFFTGGEIEKVPFKIFLYDTLSGKMTERSNLIKNNIGQSFNRKSMAADLNGDKIPDIVCVSHPECQTCEYSYFDILFSDANTKTWTQKTMKISNRMKSEGYYHGVALGDVDNDGDNDVVLANENTGTGGVSTLLNNGKGEFSEQNSMAISDPCCSTSRLAWTTELADLNKDGFLDLLYWHDETFRGIAYGEGSGYFGKKIEQRFEKSKYTYTMDYDPVDLDKDGDLDLILTTTNNGWELVFLENTGNDSNQKVIWKDRSAEINNVLKASGFYSTTETSDWVPYIQLVDLNKDGILDIVPQKPLNNGDNTWIVYGVAPWSFSFLKNNIPEIPAKPVYKKTDHETTQMVWDKFTQIYPRSSKRIKSWNIYFANKYFGDRSMVKDRPIAVSVSNFVPAKNSIVFDYKFPYPKTYIRIAAVDSSGLETPLSEIDSVICSNPPKPLVTWNGTDLITAQGQAQYQWYRNNTIIETANKANYSTQIPGQYKVMIKNASGCVESSAVFDLIVTGISAMNEEGNKIQVYPNPSQNEITIEFDKKPVKPLLIKVIGANGTVIESWISAEQKKTINIELLPSGKYWLTVNEEKTRAIPFVKLGQ